MGVVLSCIKGSKVDDEVDEAALPFLHGRLQVRVLEAQDLPDTDTAFFNVDGKDVTDPYVTAKLGKAKLFTSSYIHNELNPRWDEIFDVYVCHQASNLEVQVRDKEHIGDAHVASVFIPVDEFMSGEPIENWYDLMNGDKQQGRILLGLHYTSINELLSDHSLEVRDTYFSMRAANRVTLYQDAHTPQLPQFDGVTSPNGEQYMATTAWIDVFSALQHAQKFIYITGWSVNTAIQLVRGEEDPDGVSHVGELLKRKAAEGVRVLMLVWNEKLSTAASPGLMGTHDEETRLFFENTGVECKLVGRNKRSGFLASEFVGTCYTHHQKTVIVDTDCDDDSGRRRLVAFIGGLDITDGRYDTPEFPLWASINTLHGQDFYNNCVMGATKELGPRQPWHDCHARVEGPVALDIMRNFEERWRCQVQECSDLLYELNEDFDVDACGTEEPHEGGLWNVQLLRSITSDSCVFSSGHRNALSSKDGKAVDDSIMRCSVQRIRKAKNFIYFENQYFLGSAYSWFGDNDALSEHILPREISEKIVEKICSGNDFKVYVVIPMFPEGDPTSAAIQEILYWQFRTMETMYKRIAKALLSLGVSGRHPTDYLSFYCLGKREAADEMPEDQFATPAPDTPAGRVRSSRRHPIYVHSKMTVFDDEYVMVGSANINQRSLGGNRDTEIAVGAYQPDHTVDAEGDPRGAVHTYRSALWAAHLGGHDEAYRNPSSDECLARVREVTAIGWEQYTADDPLHMDIHMLPYPITVDEAGNVCSLESPWDCFPDTTGKVRGARSGFLPGKLTT